MSCEIFKLDGLQGRTGGKLGCNILIALILQGFVSSHPHVHLGLRLTEITETMNKCDTLGSAGVILIGAIITSNCTLSKEI